MKFKFLKRELPRCKRERNLQSKTPSPPIVTDEQPMELRRNSSANGCQERWFSAKQSGNDKFRTSTADQDSQRKEDNIEKRCRKLRSE
ncbi:hypothetical protein AVEN_60125-1 [Araneus ventricosus]|uniref:Uncharacterized protein n=1 Tax=Araneus ventricosus TaxID=182803 RepID=A0A4Y2GHT6_ARAVE|nr:hypothetical protein AVEN_60125-1 [Araneus ventricosus]